MTNTFEPYGGNYKGYDFYIRPGYAGNPCGYVKIDIDHMLHIFVSTRKCGDVDYYVHMHGGCTHKGGLPGQEGLWVGFDTSHAFDNPATQNIEFVEMECKNIIDQLINWNTRIDVIEEEINNDSGNN